MRRNVDVSGRPARFGVFEKPKGKSSQRNCDQASREKPHQVHHQETLLFPFSQTPKIIEKETFMSLSQLFEVANIVVYRASSLFSPLGGGGKATTLHSHHLNMVGLHASTAPSPESPFSPLCDSLFQMKSSRDPHQPFPNLLPLI